MVFSGGQAPAIHCIHHLFSTLEDEHTRRMSTMKRRAAYVAEEPQRGQRQPQISCDSCRKRKLKCDRSEPCSSCAVRGLPCHRQPSAKRVVVDQSHGALSSEDVLRRLNALEEAVFNSERSPARHQGHNLNSYGPLANTPVSSATAEEHSQLLDAAKTLHETSANYDYCDLEDLSGSFKFAISPTPCPTAFPGSCPQFQNATSTNHDAATQPRLIPMMPREQALALLQDYLDHAFPLLPIIHSTTTRTIVSEFYDQLSRGGHVRPQVAALILCISAVSAWLWQPDAGRHARFASVREATQLWEIWRKWSFEILTRTQASDGSTLEGAQTWALLSYATLNAEGGSAYFRFLHYTAITAARELSMHLVDSPKADRSEDRVTREVKRRLWWHLAVTDWMLGSVGGPYEGTYSIQPRHMNVRYPRNLNDNDVATWDDSMTAPLNVPTQMSFVLQRIRIGEIVRTTLDARPPGSPDVDMPDDYNTVVALDRLFEQAFMDMPPFFQIPSPFQPEKLDSFQLQGAILQLCLLSRRARLHRPFFLQQHISANPRHQPSRDICLQCSRKSVCISVGILEASLDAARRSDTGSEPRQIEKMRPRSGLSAHRLGHIINHMFVACTVLAFYAGASSGPDNSPARRQLGDSGAEEPDRTAVHAELTNACRVLAALGAESPVAARLLRNLVSLLRRYQVQGVDGDEMLERLEGKERKETTGKGAAGHGHSQTFGETEVLSDVDGGLAPVAGPGDAHVDFDGLWDEFMGSSDDYTQLFADLDYHCGMGVNVA